MKISTMDDQPPGALTIETLRGLPGFSELTEEQALGVIQQVREYCLLIHTVYGT